MLPGILITLLQTVKNQAWKMKQGKRVFLAVKPKQQAPPQNQGLAKVLVVRTSLFILVNFYDERRSPRCCSLLFCMLQTMQKMLASLLMLHWHVLIGVTNCEADVSQKEPGIYLKCCSDVTIHRGHDLLSHCINTPMY